MNDHQHDPHEAAQEAFMDSLNQLPASLVDDRQSQDDRQSKSKAKRVKRDPKQELKLESLLSELEDAAADIEQFMESRNSKSD